MCAVLVEANSLPAVASREAEFVERKGLGHPDSICDALMEAASQALCRLYLARAGRVLHHNTDKGLLVAGAARPRLGGGVVDAPMRLVVGDRATVTLAGETLPLDELLETTVRQWFRTHLRFVDPDRHVVIQNELRPGSAELVGLFGEASAAAGIRANDTSAAVGFAPLSETERLVLDAERYLNSAPFKRAHPETGEDVKVMGVRRGRQLQLTVAVAMVDRYLPTAASYFEATQQVAEQLSAFLHTRLENLDHVQVQLNTLDRQGIGEQGMYLTVLGTSAESADGGEVGRGNRVNGLISLCRPMTLEAAAGKNPVSHVGKIYNLFAHQLAGTIHHAVEPVREATVWLVSQIGAPLDQPWCVSTQLALEPGTTVADVREPVQQLVRRELAQIDQFVTRIVADGYPVC